MRKCSKCKKDYLLTLDKPGLIHHCPKCSTERVERLGGNMIYSHKTAPDIEIKPISRAVEFASKQRRFGAGVTCCLTQSKNVAKNQLLGENPFERERDDAGSEKERKLA
jgi:hypothetical protein